MRVYVGPFGDLTANHLSKGIFNIHTYKESLLKIYSRSHLTAKIVLICIFMFVSGSYNGRSMLSISSCCEFDI